MLKKINISVLFALLFFVSAYSVFATDINMDVKGAKNFTLNKNVGPVELKFVSSAPLEEIIGYADDSQVKSNITFNPADVEKTTGTVSFPTNSLETGIKKRDGHLASDAWLDAAKFPQISFQVTELKNVKVKGFDKPAGRATIEALAVGTFSLHGKTKQISVPVTLIYIKESDNTKKRASGDLLSVEGNFTILLKDFDVVGKQDIVGSKVGESINIYVKLYYNGK